MNSEKERQRSNRLLTARQLLHVTETFHRRHSVILDTCNVGLLQEASIPSVTGMKRRKKGDAINTPHCLPN